MADLHIRRAPLNDLEGCKPLLTHDSDHPVSEASADGTLLAETGRGASGLLERVEGQCAGGKGRH
jgi:hypothetical protein